MRDIRDLQLEPRLTPSNTPPALTAEANAGGESSRVLTVAAAGTNLFFNADVQGLGEELYVTDGTAAGTHLVADINPGSASSIGYGFQFKTLGSLIIFGAESPATGGELWRSDGTASGTFLLRDINPGSNSYRGGEYAELYQADGFVYFSANDGVHGSELWRTDGTTAGTVMVADINPGPYGSFPYDVAAFQGHIYFRAYQPGTGSELWRTDSTATVTEIVADIVPGTASSYPQYMTTAGNQLFFASKRGLWKTDGTVAGTVLVKSMGPVSGYNNATPFMLRAFGDTLLFAGSDATHGAELWKSDGTPAGTVMVKDVNPVSDSLTYVNAPGYAVGNQFYFFPRDGSHGNEMWVTDGTESGTRLVKDIRPGPESGASFNLVPFNGRVAFSSNDGVSGSELWISDGTSAGTMRVQDIAPGSASSYPSYLAAFNSRLYFGAEELTHGRELWSSDGTAAGTNLAVDLTPKKLSSRPEELTVAGGLVYFTTSNANDAGQLWKSDGTPAGTSVVNNGLRVRSYTEQYFLREFNGSLVYVDSTGGYSYRKDTLWTTSGGGSSIIRDDFQFIHTAPFNIGGTMYFAATGGQGQSGDERLWRSNGTSTGTVPLAILSTSQDPLPADFTNANGRLFFSANGIGGQGRELWTSDGTGTGTKLAADINPGSAGSDPSALVNVNGNLYFAANNSANGLELYKAPGSTGMVSLLRDIVSGSGGSEVGNLVNFNGTLLFTANDGINGNELWTSDGSSTGTVLLANLAAGSASSSPQNLRVIGNTLYFSALSAQGRELWKSDGTAAGTVPVADLMPGVAISEPLDFTGVNGAIYFTALDTAGRQLWRLEPSTGQAAKILLESGSAAEPANLTALGTKLLFAAYRSDVGRELFGLREAAGVASITSTSANGTYVTGQSVNVTLNFSENITLTGTLSVTLDSGAVLSVGAFSGTAASATYVIAAGQTSADLTVTGLSLSGTLKDDAGNDAVLTLPMGNLGANANLIVNPPPPSTVSFIRINLGSSQRSRVTTVEVSFTSPVSVSSLGNIRFTRVGSGTAFTVDAFNGLQLSGTGTVSTLTLTFANLVNDGVEYRSLADGDWKLNIPGLSYESPAFHRFFGDVNGDRQVDGPNDFAAFKFQTAVDDPFDSNGDGVVDGPTDFAYFGGRFGRTL